MVATAGAPIEPDRDPARRWAVDELAKREYGEAVPDPVTQALSWLWQQLIEGLSRVPGNGSPLLAAVVGIAVLAVIALVVWLVTGGVRRNRARHSAADLFGGMTRTASEHRTLARAAEAAGDWRVAIQEMFRATARSLEERAILDVRPGRTADEVAHEAGVALPLAASGLHDAATAFDEVTYGDRPGDADRFAAVAAMDALVTATKPRVLVST